MKSCRALVTAVSLLIGTACVPVAWAADDVTLAPDSLPGSFAPHIDTTNAPSKGPADATVTIVEFSDFECPFSAQSARAMRRLLEIYPTQVRWVSKQYPLKFHKQAPLAHEAALAAGEQGKFFEMYQLIYANQNRLTRDDLVEHARELGLDVARFSKALDERNLRSQVVRDVLEGRRLGVFATPTLFVNGHRVMGAKVLPELRAIVEHELRVAAGGAGQNDPSAQPSGK